MLLTVDSMVPFPPCQIEAACLGGGLALAVAVMYERNRGAASPWHAYLAVLPSQEDVPIAWGAQQVHHLLCGTELHQVGNAAGSMTIQY